MPLSRTVSLASNDSVDEALLVIFVETLFCWVVEVVLLSDNCGRLEAE